MHTKIKLNGSAVIVLPLLILLGCNFKRQGVVSSIDSAITDSIILPISIEDRKGFPQYFEENKEGKVAYMKKSSFILYLYDLNTNLIFDSISLSKYREIFVGHYVRSRDSVFILLNNNCLVLVSKGKTKLWDISPIVTLIDTFSHTASFGNPIFLFKDTLKVDLATSRVQKNPTGPNITHKKYSYSLNILFKPNSVTLLDKFNPHFAYLNQQDYLSSLDRIAINGNEFLFTLNHADTMWKHHFKDQTTNFIPLKSNYFTPNIPFDYSKLFDYEYCNNYEISQSRIGLTFYNARQKVIYQFMKHAAKPIEEDGTINEYYDCPFSLFLVSEDFKQQKEFYIPPNFIDNLFLSFCDDEYLYVPADENKQTNKGQTKYYKLKLSF